MTVLMADMALSREIGVVSGFRYMAFPDAIEQKY